MVYHKSGTLRTGRQSPTDETIEIGDWTNVDLIDLMDDNGIVRFPIADIIVPGSTDTDYFSGINGGSVTDISIDNTAPVLITKENDLSWKYSGGADGEGVISVSGLQNYPEQGDTFALYTHMTSGGPQPLFLFGAQGSDGSNGGYSIRVDATNDLFRISRFDNGWDPSTHRTVLESVSPTLAADTWYEFEVQWGTDDTISSTLYDVDQSTGDRNTEIGNLQVTDGNYTQGGVGMQRGGLDGTATLDFWTLISGSGN